MKRILSLALAGITLLFSLTACSSGRSGDEKIVLTVWGPQEDQVNEDSWLPSMCKLFNDAHPEWDITFKYGVCSEGEAGKNISADPSGSADVYFFANDQLGMLLQANAISQLGGDTLEEIKRGNTERMISSVTGSDGGVYGVPFTGNTWFMFYNKSIFSEEDIKSLDTMLEKGKVAFPLTNSWYMGAFYLANGCTLFGDNGNDASEGVEFGSKAGIEATEYLVSLSKNKNFVNDAEGAGLSGLLNGDIGAVFTGTWDAQKIEEALGENYGVASLPTARIGGAERRLLSFAGSKAIGVNPNCKNQRVAVALAAFLGSEEAQREHYRMRGIIPCNEELLMSEELMDNPVALAQRETIENASVIQPNIPEMDSFWKPTENMGKAIVNGDITLENAREKTEAYNASLQGK